MAERFQFGVEVATRLVGDADWSGVLEELRGEKRLSAAMRDLNRMLQDPELAGLANEALRRIGLDDRTLRDSGH